MQDEQFHQTVTIALRNVAEAIAEFNETELPKEQLIQRRSSNYYAVNVNSSIDANVLENYLIIEFNELSLNTDFEFAVYDCFSDDLVYGKYCKMTDDAVEPEKEVLHKFSDLDYYFVVRFPSRESYLLSNIWQAVLFSFLALLACSIFIYSIWLIVKQKKLSEMQKDFINNMTHEFKTPISSIKIASDVLAKTESIKSDNRLTRYASIIQHQNERLNDQVEKVLNIARLEKDEFEMNIEEVVLQTMIHDNIKAESVRYTHEKVNLTLDLPEDDVIIRTDKLHFTNIINNIIDNAIKYCRQEPQILISTQENEKDKIRLAIKDNGIGLSEEDVKKVFTKFYRVPTGNVHNVKGFGLGLFYVRSICRSLGWEIGIKSHKGEGTTLYMDIPNVKK